jgi:hypothetical protein
MRSSKKELSIESNERLLYKKSIDYITCGVGCNCLVVLSETGLLDFLLKNATVSEKDLANYGDSLCLKSALITLSKCGVILIEEESFELTEFGRALADNIGLINIFFNGYGELISHQDQIVQHKILKKNKLLRGTSISKSAVQISEEKICPIIVKEVASLKLPGTICDLGCGYADMLCRICNKTGSPGLGFDSEAKVIKEAREKIGNTNISLHAADITKLKGMWEDVTMLLQCHVFHDFTPDEYCVKVMNSYLLNFPNLKCFFYMDTVTPSIEQDAIFPGFDYVHGLLGIKTRTYEETRAMFSKSAYRVLKEVPLDLPSTFLWLLVPKTGGQDESK